MLKTLTTISILTAVAFADEINNNGNEGEKQAGEKAHSVLPALKVLPAGSVLKTVSIPRYNPDYTPASVLRADRLEIVSKQHIKGSGVDITLFDKTGEVKADTHLNSVDYNQSTGIIKTTENLTFSGDTFDTTSQGLVLDWDQQRGFFLGKNQTIIYFKKPTSMKDLSDNTKTSPLNTPKKALALATAATIASSPTILTAEDFAKFDALSKPSTEHIEKLDKQVKAEITTSETTTQTISQSKQALTKLIGNIPEPAKDQPIPGELKPVAGKDSLSIKSDGNMFFDANKGILVFSDNVRVTHPQYKLSCEGELKVVLKEKPAKDKAKDKAAKKKLKPTERFGDVSQIIATKNVIIQGKDKEGKPIVARAGVLIYNHATGAIIIRGLHSRVTTADKQIKITQKDGHIMLDRDWHITAKGSQIDFNMDALKNNGR